MKKLSATFLILVSVFCILCGCGGDDNKVASKDSEKSKETIVSVSYPTLKESQQLVEEQFPQYANSILKLENQVHLSEGKLSFVVFYENSKFKKIWCKNSDFSSAYNELATFFSNFADIGITKEELQENMEESMKMPKYTSYTYEDENFEYNITEGEDYVQISLACKGNSLKVSTKDTEESSSTESKTQSTNKEKKDIIGGWDYNYAYDINTELPTTPAKPYVSFYKFNEDGTGTITVMQSATFEMIETTWEFDCEQDEIDYYSVYLNGDKNEELGIAFVDGVVAMGKDSALIYYKKQGNTDVSNNKKIDDCSEGHSWKEITKRIHHKEEGHYEQGIVDYNYITVYGCPQCSQEFYYYDQYAIHFDTHIAADNNIRFLKDSYKTRSESEPIYGDVWVVDKEAYYEEEVERYECSKCGEIKY